MNPIWTIFIKEIRDNVRDKRSLFFAVLYGPVLMPLLMIGPLLLGMHRNSIDFEEPKTIAVVGSEHAAHLMQFLKANNLDVQEAPDEFQQEIEAGRIDMVLEIPTVFNDRFRAGQPAEVLIHYDESDEDSRKIKRQLSAILDRYDRTMRQLRFQARGIDSRIFEPLNVVENDVSFEGLDVPFIAYIVPFLLLYSMMMGGFYLAVDTTAGERERQSLEPLLSLPMSRLSPVLGKYAAVLFFVILSMVLPLITSYALFSFLPADLLGSGVDFGLPTFLVAFVLGLPLALLITAFLLTVAAFARNTKEAQTHLSLAMMVPLVPFFLLQYMNVPTQAMTLLIPIISQFKVMEMAVASQAIPVTYFLLTTIGSIVAAVGLLGATIGLYQRERILL